MSGFRLIKLTSHIPRFISTKLPSYLLALILINLNLNIVIGQHVETVEVYKCQGSNLPSGYQVEVPSYDFSSTVILRIKDKPFLGCAVPSAQTNPQELEETEFTYRPNGTLSPEDIEEIELYGTAISPKGILNVANYYYTTEDYCILTYTSAENEDDKPSMKMQYCPVNCSNSGGQLCIPKCCPAGKVLDLVGGEGFTCGPSGNKSWSAFFYDDHSWKRLSLKDETSQAKKTHYFKQIMKEACNVSADSNDTGYEEWYMRKLQNQTISLTRLLANGELIYVSPHRLWALLDSQTKFCIDGIQNYGGPESSPYYSGDEQDQVVLICSEKLSDEEPAKLSKLYMYSLFVASAFYLATAITYGLLWDSQNTHGWTVFSLVLSQFFMCVFVGNAHKMGLTKDPTIRNSRGCVSNAILAHFFMLASFTWLTVINFDLWSTFRSLKPRNHKSVDLKKFSMYSVIGWGAPLIVVILGVILDHTFPERDSLVLVPEYGQNICYVATWAQGAYVYYIMAGLLTVIVIFSALTCTKIYEFTKDTAQARSSSSAGDRQIFSLYAKLSVVLGVSWIFEFISWAASSEDHQHWIWTVFDMYNLLTAVFIFVIFACKLTNLTQLVNKYPCLHFLKPALETFTKLMTGKQSDATGSSIVTPTPGTQEMKKYGAAGKGSEDSSSEVKSSKDG